MEVRSATGKRFAVVAGHPLAAQAAAKVLESDEGNVVDAAIAGAAVLTVVLPQACSLGGDCFALVHMGNETHGMNGSGRSPEGLPVDATPEQLAIGPLSCGVPGVVGAWEAMQRRFGRAPWSRVFDAAITLARDGAPVGNELAVAMRAAQERLNRDPGGRTLFLKDGKPYALGEALVQPALGDTLAAIARDGSAALYRGEIGRQLCSAVSAAGGVLDPRDLAAYAPDWATPLEYVYRGHAVRVMPPNSWGLFMLLQLAALEGIAPADWPSDPARRLQALIGAARASFERGAKCVADPREVAGAASSALSAESISALRQVASAPAPFVANVPRSLGTATLSVADSQGNGVTIVQSIFMPFGSMIADNATGIIMNNRLLGFSREREHPNAAAPAKRPAHTLNPVMVFDRGSLRMQLATPGGSGQTLTLVQVLSNVLDRRMDLPTAVAEPRWSMNLQGEPLLEPELGAGTAAALATLGVQAKLAPEQRSFFGSAECIHSAEGGLTAVADSRRDAGAAAL